MNEINAENLLSQIRTLGAGLQPGNPSPVSQPGSTGFGDLLKNTVQAVNQSQQQAQQMAVDFQAGVKGTNLAEVMIASQKADLSFRAMTEVRNKLVGAYQEIMNMPV